MKPCGNSYITSLHPFFADRIRLTDFFIRFNRSNIIFTTVHFGLDQFCCYFEIQ